MHRLRSIQFTNTQKQVLIKCTESEVEIILKHLIDQKLIKTSVMWLVALKRKCSNTKLRETVGVQHKNGFLNRFMVNEFVRCTLDVAEQVVLYVSVGEKFKRQQETPQNRRLDRYLKYEIVTCLTVLLSMAYSPITSADAKL